MVAHSSESLVVSPVVLFRGVETGLKGWREQRTMVQRPTCCLQFPTSSLSYEQSLHLASIAFFLLPTVISISLWRRSP